MTNTEAAALVESEVKPRYHTFNETQFSDWVRAMQYCDGTTARDIIRQIAIDPDTTLTCKAFAKIARTRRKVEPAVQIAPPAYDALVRCLEAPAAHPDWQGLAWFRLDGFDTHGRGSKEYVTQYAAQAAGRVQAHEGGRWCGEIRPADNTPYRGPLTNAERKQMAEDHSLNGPDGPGKRFLLQVQAQKRFERLPTIERMAIAAFVKPEPPSAPPMFSKPPLFTGNASSTRIDWSSDDLPPVRDQDVPADLVEAGCEQAPSGTSVLDAENAGHNLSTSVFDSAKAGDHPANGAGVPSNQMREPGAEG